MFRGILITGLVGAALIGGAVWASVEEPTTPEETKLHADEHKQRIVLDRYLCRKMAACSKYDRVRVDCATAGSIDTCLRIKMGDDFRDVETCGVDYEGGPAVLLDPRTPMPFAAFSSIPCDDGDGGQ